MSVTMSRLVLALFALAVAGCRGESTPPVAAPPASEAANRPAAVLPMGPQGQAPATASEPAGELKFELPTNWPTVPPSSSMRIAQATIPGPAGAGELAVFWFGVGGGGGVEANLERWVGQMEQPQGAQPQRETFTANGLAVTWIDVRGTLLPSSMGSGPANPQAGSRLFGAVIEGPGGPWFFKATGPEPTLAAARADFLVMLRSARLGA